MNSRGSEWNKWDLHLHSPKTWLANGYSGVSIDDFVKNIIDNNIKVVGLTNYFKFADGEISGDNNIKLKLEQKGVVVFPNIELRLNYTNKESDLCDYHLVFSPDLTTEKIDVFLNNLDVHIAGGQKKKAASLTPSECRHNKTYVDFESMLKTLNDDSIGVRKFVVCGFLSRGKGEARSASVPDFILEKSDFIIHSSDSEENIVADYEFWTKDDRKPIRPIFQGSDAHKLLDIGKKYTWVKSQATFNGLRQIRCNPAERISFNSNNPTDIKTQSFIIDKIVFGNDKEILFNPDLNSIIGFRANGKSILMKCLAINIDKSSYENRINNPDKVARDEEFVNNHFSNAKIFWKDGSENGGDPKNPKKIFYLSQGFLSNLAYDDGARVELRDDFLLSLLRKNDSFCNAEKQVQEFLDNNAQNIGVVVDTIISDIDNKKRLLEINRSLGTSEELEKEKASLVDKIKDLGIKNKITESDTEAFQDAKNLYSKSEKSLRTITQDIKILETIKLTEDIIEISSIATFDLSDDLRSEISEELRKTGKEELSKIIANKIASLGEETVNLQKQMRDCKEKIEELSPKFEAQKELASYANKKMTVDNNLDLLIANNQEINKLEENISNNFIKLQDAYFSYGTKQVKMFETVSFETDSFEFVEINIDVKKDEEILNSFIERNINTKKTADVCAKSKHFICSDNKAELTKNNFTEVIKDFFDSKFIYKKDGAVDKKQVIRELLINPYKINFLDSIRVKGKSTLFRDMTGGQKAIVMLELIFKFDFSAYPILLDQPEDDLDTSAVAKNIVDFIKSQKENRQIFIVSHHASLVVCSDSEEIIVANNNSGKFDYATGAIEDNNIKESIIDILEGGREALKLRMRKLGIND